MYQHVPTDVSESSLRGRVLSMVAAIAIGSLFFLETKAYLSTKLETDLSLRSVYEIEDQQIRLNFDITLMDLSCDLATVDVYSSVGHRKNITTNIVKHPVDENGVRQRYEAQSWHEDDFELWDPAIHEEIGPLHEDGEDALNLSDKSFEYAIDKFEFVFVKFYSSGGCDNCRDIAPTWEALGEVVTDTSMLLVDEMMKEQNLDESRYSDDEYEAAVNQIAPVLVTKLDCQNYPEICAKENIRLYPTMRLFVNGKAAGDYNGHRTVLELVHWLIQVESDHRKPEEMTIRKVLDVANERVSRNEEEETWNEELQYYRSPLHSWNSTRHPGCQLTGHVMVDRTPGRLTLQAQSYGHDIAVHMTNLSHIVHHFSFGDVESQQYIEGNGVPAGLPAKLAESLHPLDGRAFVTGELHQAYHHHLSVVTVEFDQGKVFSWARQQIQRVFRILHNTQLSIYRTHLVPETSFSYDLSPLAVQYYEVPIHWYDYVTGIVGLVGGAYTVLGMFDSGLSSFFVNKRRRNYC